MDYGKPFENYVRAALEREGACVDRLPDQMTGYANSSNPGDFTAYKKPYYYYIEAKSCVHNSFSIKAHIREGQWIQLLKKTAFKKKGVYTGYVIWFVKDKAVVWVPATNLSNLYKSGIHEPTIDELLAVGSPVEFEQVDEKKIVLISLLKTIAATKQQ